VVSPRAQFARNLKYLRERRGMTQEQLAFEAGLHRDTISKVERMKREPKVGTIVKLARGLEVPLGPLFAEIEPGRTVRGAAALARE
jgi:transcriptional regulator with XRE-family HTH domain